MPDGWGTVRAVVPLEHAVKAKAALQGSFPYVETTYYRRSDVCDVRAFYGPIERGSEFPDLNKRGKLALEGIPRDEGGVVLYPW
jgi:hypothetical protein